MIFIASMSGHIVNYPQPQCACKRFLFFVSCRAASSWERSLTSCAHRQTTPPRRQSSTSASRLRRKSSVHMRERRSGR